MTTTTLATVDPVTSFTALGVTINQGGVDVDSSLVAEILEAALLTNVTIVVGGVAEDIAVAGPVIFNPATGPPGLGSYSEGQLATDSAGGIFVCLTPPDTWIALAAVGLSSIDCGSSS